MKKHAVLRLAALALALLLALAAAGCSDSSSASSSEPEVEEPLYPLSIGDTEILVGETKLGTLLDAGFEVTWSEMDANNQITQHTVDPSEMLEPMSYYSGGSVWITEHVFAHIAFVTEEEAVPLGEAVIARLEVNFSYDDEDIRAAGVKFNGIPYEELTREKAGDVFPDFTGDDNMWFSPASMRNYDYGVYYSNGSLSKITVECEYDVDWNGGN